MARAFGEQLQTEIDLWNLEFPATAFGSIEDDSRRIVFRLNEAPSPPLIQWSALVGQLVGSLRVALDSFMWQAAHLDGNEPKNPRRVYFPLFDKGKQGSWRSWRENIGNIPGALEQRLYSLQGFVGSELGDDLRIIQRMNNHDKHREALHLGLDAETLSMHGVGFELCDYVDGVDSSFSAQPFPDGIVRLESGATVAAVASERGFKEVDGQVTVGVAPEINIAADGDEPNLQPVGLVLPRLHAAARHAIDTLCASDGSQIQNPFQEEEHD
ncbi:hypothetical protein [Brevibacterium linens]|nr:hypothetical protein [Brevibacterium linens]